MALVTLTALSGVVSDSFTSDWDAESAALDGGTTVNGSTGTGSIAPAGMTLLFSAAATLDDDSTTVPLDAIISDVTIRFTWTLAHDTPLELRFGIAMTPLAAPGGSGSFSESTGLTVRADLFGVQAVGWSLSASGDGNFHDASAIVSGFAVDVTYTSASEEEEEEADAPPALVIAMEGVDPVVLCPRVGQDVVIEDALDEAPTTASFTVTDLPPGAAPIEVDAYGVPLFRGHLQTIEQVYEGRPTQLAHHVTAIDRVWLLNRRRPFGHYVDVSASDIVIDLATTFAPDFDTAFVQTDLLPITIDFDGSDDFVACLSRIAAAVGGCHHYIGNLDPPDLHFFYSEPPVTDFGPVGIAGPTTAPTVDPPSGSPLELYVFRVRYKYADGRVSGFGPISTVTSTVTVFDDLPIGPDVDGVPVAFRQVFYQNLLSWYSTRWIPRFQVHDNVTTAVDLSAPPSTVAEANGAAADGSEFRFVWGPTSVPTRPRPPAPGAITLAFGADSGGRSPWRPTTSWR